MTEMEQRICCPGCKGKGWVYPNVTSNGPMIECPVCDCRGTLIIHDTLTQRLPILRRPKG